MFIVSNDMTLKHLKACFFFALMQLPMDGKWRRHFAKWGGVDIKIGKRRTFIGKSVQFDTMYPENIIIGNHVHITAGCKFLTHYLDTSAKGIEWLSGKIEIGEDSFIGMDTIIAKPVKIGKGVIIGAGSVVTKDIPDYEIWAGNPAKFIKKRTE